MSKFDDIEKFLVPQGCDTYRQLFDEQNISLCKYGPMCKSEAIEKLTRYTAATHPLYVVKNDEGEFFLFY